MSDNNEFQRTPCTDECYIRISDLRKAILNNPYDPTKGEIASYLRYLKYNTPFRTDARKKGRWIPQDHNKSNGLVTTSVYYFPKCSECGHSGEIAFAFCPHCGADMRGEENE